MSAAASNTFSRTLTLRAQNVVIGFGCFNSHGAHEAPQSIPNSPWFCLLSIQLGRGKNFWKTQSPVPTKTARTSTIIKSCLRALHENITVLYYNFKKNKTAASW